MNLTSPKGRSWGFSLTRRSPKAKEQTGFHSLQSELLRQSAAWDLDSARDAAAREVQSIVSGPEALSKLSKIREEYDQQLAGVEVQLSLAAGRQADEAKAILKLADRCREGIEKVEGMQGSLTGKLETVLTAVPHYDLLKRVYVTRRNLGRTLVDLDSIVAVPTEMKRIEDILNEEGEQDAKDHALPEVHKSLMQLERRQEAALYQARASMEERESLEKQFGKLERFYDRVSARIWQIVRNCAVMAQEKPAVLVKALQMIERQERADEGARRDSVQRQGGEVQVRGWYATAILTIKEYMSEKFEFSVGSRAQEAPLDIQLLISEHEKLVDELTIVKDLVEPCFPPRYHIFDVFAETYHALTVELVQKILDAYASSLSTKDIIDIVNWIRDYHSQLDSLAAEVSPILTDDLDRLLQGYNFQTETMMRNWSSRILEEDLKMQPESGPDGRLYTIAPIDLFKMVGQQFEVVDVLGLERSTYTLAMTVYNVLDDYRAGVEGVLRDGWGTLELSHIAAQTNNCTRMMDGCSQLLEDLEGKLEPERLENVELQLLIDGFTAVSRFGTTAVCNVIFQDIGPLFQKLFTQKWLDGDKERVVDSIVATIKDYAEEVQEYLHETYYRKMLVEVMERVVVSYGAQLLRQTSAHNVDASGGIRADAASLEALFTICGLPNRMLALRLKPVLLLASLSGVPLTVDAPEKEGKAGTPDLEKFAAEVCQWLEGALAAFPDLCTDVIYRVLKQRSDIDGRARNAVLVRCNEVHAELLAKVREKSSKGTWAFFTEVYKELGAQPGPHVPTGDGVLTSLATMVTKGGQMRIRGTGHRRQPSAEAGVGLGAGVSEAEKGVKRDRGANAVDIMYRLQM